MRQQGELNTSWLYRQTRYDINRNVFTSNSVK